jgi:hypothetical protein
MRFISHYRNFAVGIFPRSVEILPGGVEREIRPGLTAHFVHGDVTAEELRFAESTFAFHGRTLGEDTVTLTPIIGRLSTYDTENPENVELYHRIDQQMEGQPTMDGRGVWAEGYTKALVEAKLSERADGDMFAKVPEETVAAPWPRYNEFAGSIDELVARLRQDGHHLPAVLAYEKQNLRRPDVMKAIEAALEEHAEVESEEFVEA